MNAPEREQRLVFAEVAREYDRFRPSYPDALFDTIVEFGDLRAGDPALEIGAGTGKATVGFLERGLRVHALEPTTGMAAIARAKGVDVEESLFETWDLAGRRFRLAYAAQAWHWVTGDDRYDRASGRALAGRDVRTLLEQGPGVDRRAGRRQRRCLRHVHAPDARRRDVEPRLGPRGHRRVPRNSKRPNVGS